MNLMVPVRLRNGINIILFIHIKRIKSYADCLEIMLKMPIFEKKLKLRQKNNFFSNAGGWQSAMHPPVFIFLPSLTLGVLSWSFYKRLLLRFGI